MEPNQKAALRKCRVKLVELLCVEQVIDVLHTTDLFTALVLESIEAEKSRAEKVRKMLDYLNRRGPDAFDKFLTCLRHARQDFLADMLLRTYLELKGENVPSELYGQGKQPCGQLPPLHTQETGGGDTYMSSATGSLLSNGDQEDVEMTVTGVQESMAPPGESYALPKAGVPSHQHGYSGNHKEEYKMESNPRGLLFIINNRDFGDRFPQRQGTNIDCSRLKDLFMQLGFGVEVKHNLTILEIKENLAALSRLDLLNKVDALAVAILTHGSEEQIWGVDEDCMTVHDAFEYFSSQNCPFLHHKPKLFIINACRGDAEDYGSLPQPIQGATQHAPDTHSVPAPSQLNVQSIPNLQDFLVAYSTVPKHVSWRHKNEGSWFIQGLVKVFSEDAADLHVVDMLVKVNREVAQNFQGPAVQIPAPQIMLTKRWFLNPPISTPLSWR